jgi:hypothetical protein
MSLPVIADTVRIALNWVESGTGQTAENVIHISGDGITAASAAAEMETAWNATMTYPTVETARIQSLSITPLDGTSATLEHTTVGPNWGGEFSGEFSPATSVIVSFGTATRGRSARGRFYYPFCAVSQLDDGMCSSAVVTNAEAAWVSFQASLAAHVLPWFHVVASYKPPGAIHDINAYNIKPAVGTQRRRQGRIRYP